MPAFLSDTFTEASTINLTARTPETGGTWSKVTGFSADINVSGGNGWAMGATTSTALYSNSATPPSADYYVECLVDRDSGGECFAGPLGRIQGGASTCYQVLYDGNASGSFLLGKIVAGTGTTLATYAASLTAGTPVLCRLEMNGTTIRMLLDGVERASVTDSSITDAGTAGVRGRTTGRILSVTADTLGGGGGSSIAAISSYYRMMRNA